MPVIEVEGLVKDYGGHRAVDGVDLVVDEGEVVALLGPNGAGKTTTVEILEGHRRRTAGRVSVLGYDPAEGGRALRDRIGIVLQAAGIDRELTAREVLEFYGAAYSRRRPSDEVLALVELTEQADKRVGTLSGGQLRRLDLALGIVGDPDLLFLDEPTTGFDPAARRRAWGLVANLTSTGVTVLLTTHYLDEAEELADRVAIIDRGRIVATGTPDDLRALGAHRTLIAFVLPAVDEPVGDLLAGVSGEVRGRGDRVEILTATPTADLAHLTGWARARGLELDGLVVSRPDLEDVYLDLIADGGAGERAGGDAAAGTTDVGSGR
ncbi:MAG: ABC transporter ATP-binding protein [Actinomyces sp.]|nr:MAG: ABC transporter ATP-binding protein [Actinomyces sp.]